MGSVESCHLGSHTDSQGWLFGSSGATRNERPGRVFLNGEEKGVPEVRGSKPKTMETKVGQLDEIGTIDKFMNYCGKPVASEVTFGQTGSVRLWSEGGGDSWHYCMFLGKGAPRSTAVLAKYRLQQVSV